MIGFTVLVKADDELKKTFFFNFVLASSNSFSKITLTSGYKEICLWL